MASDLSPAVKAAATAIENELCAAERLFDEEIRQLARVSVAAARPVIESEVRNAVAAELVASTITASTPLAEYRAQVEAELRERIAAEIRAMPGRPDELPDTELAEQMAVKVFASTKDELFCGDIGWRAARTVAARIARGGASDGQ